ncbi:MAG: hypothetical protein JSS72_11755 [Armatimonadetes bacterium]|nr:hypothetical protein [Armatimonadota bacterium]
MNQTLEQTLFDLDAGFPESLYVLCHSSTCRYGCFCHNGIHGLACFSTENAAFRFAEWIDLSGLSAQQVSFDEAREVAKNRPLPVTCLMLLDDLDSPQIHYIR